MAMTIGILGGTGKQGFALAKRLVNNNYNVIIGSRSKEKGALSAERLNNVTSSTLALGGNNEFACTTEIVILSIPFDQIKFLLTPFIKNLENKVVIDMTVNIDFGKFPSAVLENGLSSYQYVRDLLPESDVVMAFKTLSYMVLSSDEELNQTDFQMTTSDMAFSITKNIAEKIGLSPIRIRGINHSHTIERMAALAIQLNKEYPGSHIGFNLTGLKFNKP